MTILQGRIEETVYRDTGGQPTESSGGFFPGVFDALKTWYRDTTAKSQPTPYDGIFDNDIFTSPDPELPALRVPENRTPGSTAPVPRPTYVVQQTPSQRQFLQPIDGDFPWLWVLLAGGAALLIANADEKKPRKAGGRPRKGTSKGGAK